MKNIISMLVLALSIGYATGGRSQDVIYSPYDKFDFHNGDYEVIGMTGGYLYTYENSPEGAMLEAFDDSMNKAATIILDFFPTKIYQTKFISYADKIIILYQALESNKVVQYAALLDEKGHLVNKPIELGTAKTGIFGAMKNYFYSVISEDKKTIFIYSINNKTKGIELEGKWLDDSLHVIKKSRASYKTDQTLSSGEMNMCNNGTVYLAAYTAVGAQNYADQYWILSLQEGDNKFEPIPLDLQDKFAASGYMKIDNLNNRIYFGGYYSNKKNGTNEGIIYASYNPTTHLFENLKYIPFDEQLITKAGNRHKNHAFDNYAVKQLIAKNDGGFVMVSEIQYITTRSNYMPGMGYYSSFYSPFGNTTLVREYHYGDIMALSYDKNGTREWSAIIPKEQYSQEDGGVFSSYVLLNSGGALVFLYNDFNSSHSRIQLAALEAGGNTSFNYFTSEGNDHPDWLPRAGKQVAAKILIVPCLHKKQICFAKVML